jgi:UDP-N-acetylmuramoyl-tripeptide--D-alanyl-D-alanine ligase
MSGVAIDSRQIGPGGLFVALRGEHVDGHDFVKEAFRRGAIGAIVSREMPVAGVQIIVGDAVRALSRLAAWARDVVDPIVVGITGSTGKTSTKDLLASIGSRKYSTIASPMSYNTEVSLPLALLQITTHTELLVCEMGSRGPGQIDALCKIARPHVGIVTNVGLTHFEQFGSKKAIALAKGELVEALPEGGTAVLNFEDPLVLAMQSRTRGETITFGVSPGADVRAEQTRIDEMGRPTFRLVRDGEAVWVSLGISGHHQVVNAAAACAGALALGISMEECRTGLEAAKGSPWRMQVSSAQGIKIINDAYNANPTSMVAALETASQMVGTGGRLIAVLGVMAELGPIEVAEHISLGQHAAACAGRLILVSERTSPIADGARREGLEDVVIVGSANEVVDAVGELRPGDVVLVKASRAEGMEGLADRILERAQR